MKVLPDECLRTKFPFAQEICLPSPRDLLAVALSTQLCPFGVNSPANFALVCIPKWLEYRKRTQPN